MTILITGHNGFIGSHLVEKLGNKYDFIGLSNTSTKSTIQQIRKDVRNITLYDLPGNIDCIIHLAAITDVMYCNNNPAECIDVNVKGTQNMLEIAKKTNSKFLYLSTSHVYGSPKKLPIKETFLIKPNSIYSTTKYKGENLCKKYSNAFGLDVSVLRLFSVYGPRSPKHLVTSKIISQILKKSVLSIGNLSSKRDFVYIKDVVDAIDIVLKKSNGFSVFNIGTGKSHSILEICTILQKISNKKMPIKPIKSLMRKSDVKNMIADNSKIRKLGWKPKTSLKKGLKFTYEWYKTQN